MKNMNRYVLVAIVLGLAGLTSCDGRKMDDMMDNNRMTQDPNRTQQNRMWDNQDKDDNNDDDMKSYNNKMNDNRYRNTYPANPNN